MKYHNIPTLFDNQASLINGKNIGTDSVRYIQDAGQKTAGTTYIDKNTNELYVCVTTTNSVNNDSNFSKFNLKEAFNKLDSLYTFGVNKFSKNLSDKSIKLPRGFYLACNPHIGYHGIASFQLFNLSGYTGDEAENTFYRATNLYMKNDIPSFSILFNPYTCEIKLEKIYAANSTKTFVFYSISLYGSDSYFF